MPFAIRRECACATRDGLVASSGEMTGGEKETLSQRALIGYCTISIDSSAPVTRDMADQIFGSSSAAVTRYTGEIFVFVDFVIGRDSGIVAYGEASV